MGSSSNSSSNGTPTNQKAAEAELISRATQTAIVAARSILMSGGNEEVALKTAKAAAESVLNPMNGGSDNDTISGRSSSFSGAFGGRKRRAKRQAEVVASMALMSATSTHHHPNVMGGMGMSGMGECDSFNNGSNPYGRNITIRHQDEPSVLSGSLSLSTRPPRVPKPASPHGSQYNNGQGMIAMSDNHSVAQSQQSQQSQSQQQQQNYHHQQQQQHQYRHPQPYENSQHHQQQQQQQQQQQVCSPSHRAIHAKNENNNKNSNNDILFQIESDSVSQSSTMDSEQQSSVESSSLGGSTMSDTTCADESVTAPHVRDMDIEKEDVEQEEGKKKEIEQKPSWNIAGIIMSPLTATMNMFNCGQITLGDAAGDIEELENFEKDDIIKQYRDNHNGLSGRQKILDRLSSPRVESRDDTFDEQTDSYDGGHRNTKRRDDYRDPDFGVLESSYSEGSSNAPSNLSDGTEGNIQVRSSIRETMENIVSKSKKSYQLSKDNETKATVSITEMKKKAADDNNNKKSMMDSSSRTTSSRFSISPRISKQQTTPSTSNSTIVPSPNKSVKSAGSRRPRSFFRKNRGRR
jgi:hypothetical protein